MFQRLAKFLEVREATDDEVQEAFEDGGIKEPNEEDRSVQAAFSKPTGSSPFESESRTDVNLDLSDEFVMHTGVHVGVQPSEGISGQILYDHSNLPVQRYGSFHTRQENGHLPSEETQPSSSARSTFVPVQPQASTANDDQLSEVSLDSIGSAAREAESTKEVLSKLISPVQTPITNYLSSKMHSRKGEEIAKTAIISKPRPNVYILDEKLVSAWSDPEAHLSDAHDDELLSWIRRNETSDDALWSEERSSVPHGTNYFNDKGDIANNENVGELRSIIRSLQDKLADYERLQEELKRKTDRLFFLETELVTAERSQIEMEERFRKQQTLNKIKLGELEAQIKSLSDRSLIGETESLLAKLMSNRGKDQLSGSLTAQAMTDDFMKHCGRLARRLGAESDSSSSEVVARETEAARIAGRQLAALSATLLKCEQQIKDEKLVLKNLFLSWMERGERKDAFEILARAFDFTPEDRKRMEAKNILARGASLGVNWSLSEGIADFIRDETS